MSLTAIAFWACYLSGLAAALLQPAVGLALYVLVYHLNPETQWWGASVAALNLRTSFIVACAILIGVIVRQPRMTHGAQQFPPGYLLALLFGVLVVGSLVWGQSTSERGLYLVEKYLKLMVVLFLLLRCIQTPAHFQLVILAWVTGVAYIGYQATGGVGRTIGGRLTGGLGGPDFAESSGLAVHLVASLPLIGAAFFMARTWLGRGALLLAGAFAVNALIATRTRNALAGLIVIALTGVLALPRGYRLRGVVAVGIGTLLAIQLTDPAWWDRMASVSTWRDDPSAIRRIDYWHAAVRMARDYPLGIGVGNFHETVQRYVPGLTVPRSAHNTVAACLAEFGWLGLSIWGLMIAATVIALQRVWYTAHRVPPYQEVQLLGRRCGFHLGWHAMALRAALLGYLACAMFTTRVFSEDFWLLVGLSLCLRNVARHVVATSAADAQQPESDTTTSTSKSAPAATWPAPCPPMPALGGSR
ncbi:MAG: O-antigen ligase family protein [Phycisphaerales bacterium]|nr:O-antigen ligase family protein [Phycisphaerales bacterium]